MDSRQILAEIREANISYLLLAQSLLKADRATALERLGIGEEAARVVEQMGPAQLMRIASANTLMCRFQPGDDMVWDLITQHATGDTSAAGAAARR